MPSDPSFCRPFYRDVRHISNRRRTFSLFENQRNKIDKITPTLSIIATFPAAVAAALKKRHHRTSRVLLSSVSSLSASSKMWLTIYYCRERWLDSHFCVATILLRKNAHNKTLHFQCCSKTTMMMRMFFLLHVYLKTHTHNDSFFLWQFSADKMWIILTSDSFLLWVVIITCSLCCVMNFDKDIDRVNKGRNKL